MSEGRPRTHGRGAAGFTLIEALVVLVLLGLAAAMITSAVQGPRVRTELRAAARDLASFLTAARDLANERGQTVVVRWDAASRLFVMVPDGANTPLRTLALPRGIVVTSVAWPTVNGYPSVACDPLGRAVEGGTMATQPRAIELTAEAMQSGSVTPYEVYRVTVFPVWSARTYRIRD